jgi:hypothetical protein
MKLYIHDDAAVTNSTGNLEGPREIGDAVKEENKAP